MQGQTGANPWWAALTVWSVVNAVNLLQAARFLSRVATGSMATNHVLGRVIMALAIPTAVALVAFLRSGVAWLHKAGPIVFLLFVALMTVVEYIRPIEFRSPNGRLLFWRRRLRDCGVDRFHSRGPL